MKIDLNELLDQMEESCTNCEESKRVGCYRCSGGKVLTEAGRKILELVERRLCPDSAGGWDGEHSRSY